MLRQVVRQLRKQMRTIIICSMKLARIVATHALFPIALLMGAGVANAADFEAKLAIRDHKFEPAELSVPAGTKIKLLIENQDATPEEFESNELNREKVVVGKGTITVILGPLDAGRYPFFGDFHQETAQGVLVVK
jgi:plastocyanin